MRRRNNRTKAAETLTKKDPQFGFTLPDPSSSRENSDLKRRRRGTFDDVDQRSSSKESLEAQTERSVDAKTSEFAFFKKLKSDFGLRSESSNSKSSDRVEQNLETFESRVKPGEKDLGKSSSGFSRDKDTVRSGNNLRSGGSSDEKGDIFSVKRKKLHEWVKDAWFPENPELTSKGGDLVSVLLTRLFPGTEERHPCRFSKERTDRVKRRTFVDSPRSKFLKRSYESYTEVDHSLQMKKDRSISWQGWLENSIEPSLQFATDHVHSGFIPRDPEEIGFSISHRPPLLKQRASLSFPVEETLECSPISSLHFRNYKPLSLGYHRDESVYGSEELSHERRALLVEWNTESRKTDDLPLITYPNTSSSSLTDNPWSSGYSSSHDLVSRELYPLPLPLVSHYTSDSHFEHELERERHTIDDKDAVAINLNLQTFHHTNSSASDFLTRDYTYDDNLSNSPVDYCPSEVPGCEIVSFPFSSISSSNLFAYTKRSF